MATRFLRINYVFIIMKLGKTANSILDNLKYSLSLESVLQKMDSDGTIEKIQNFYKSILENEIVYMISGNLKSAQKDVQKGCGHGVQEPAANQPENFQEEFRLNQQRD